jgi:hypothetical protein
MNYGELTGCIRPTTEAYLEDEDANDLDDEDQRSDYVDIQRGLDTDEVSVAPGEYFRIPRHCEGWIDDESPVTIKRRKDEDYDDAADRHLSPGKYFYDGETISRARRRAVPPG